MKKKYRVCAICNEGKYITEEKVSEQAKSIKLLQWQIREYADHNNIRETSSGSS